ncbi:hypothetical protein ACFYVR_23245 [Rhodococcus sp. NPDC003318]|uniref:hypothetical protein n=1 Tax=Rhodococcus sp. NPDC003318 TaxID=3364503 RepID=UPI0036811A73
MIALGAVDAAIEIQARAVQAMSRAVAAALEMEECPPIPRSSTPMSEEMSDRLVTIGDRPRASN